MMGSSVFKTCFFNENNLSHGYSITSPALLRARQNLLATYKHDFLASSCLQYQSFKCPATSNACVSSFNLSSLKKKCLFTYNLHFFFSPNMLRTVNSTHCCVKRESHLGFVYKKSITSHLRIIIH